MKNNGFSLLELSIVLVIIGLIAGGIVAGSAMIRASELRAIINEQSQYETALNNFRDKYLGVPGDLKNATAFWGIEAGTTGNDATCWDAVSTDESTCNGNGNGAIGLASTERYEQFRAFQHLSNAGLINGTFTGVGNSIISPGLQGYCDADVNCAGSKLQGSAWQFRTVSTTGSTDEYPISLSLAMFFGGTIGGTINPHAAVITTAEAWNIDVKLDDGKPALGRVMTFRNGATASFAVSVANCANNTDPALAEYDLLRDAVDCSLIFRIK